MGNKTVAHELVAMSGHFFKELLEEVNDRICHTECSPQPFLTLNVVCGEELLTKQI
jgi:hypothetical protein